MDFFKKRNIKDLNVRVTSIILKLGEFNVVKMSFACKLI